MNQKLKPADPCFCGSGRKYKRCHGEVKTESTAVQTTNNSGSISGETRGIPKFDPSQIDPSQFDPQMMAQMSQALQRLPRGQVQRIQALVQKAMAGKDVSRDAAELERILPPQFQNTMQQMMMAMGGMAGMAAPSAEAPSMSEAEMSEDEARRIVEEAAQSGKISQDEAASVLSGSGKTASKSGLFGKFFKK